MLQFNDTKNATMDQLLLYSHFVTNMIPIYDQVNLGKTTQDQQVN